MNLWILLLLLPLSLLLWVLLSPLEIIIDTNKNTYLARLGVIAKMNLLFKDLHIELKTRIFFFNISIKPGKRKRKKDKQKKKEKKRYTEMPFRLILDASKDLWKAVKIIRLELDLDTEDVILNAKLFPFFYMLSNDRIKLWINFDDKNSLLIHVRAELWALAAVGMKFLIRYTFRRIRN